jgi:hypothetical protein
MTFSAESCCWITISSNLKISSSNRILFSAYNSIICFYAPGSYSFHYSDLSMLNNPNSFVCACAEFVFTYRRSR